MTIFNRFRLLAAPLLAAALFPPMTQAQGQVSEESGFQGYLQLLAARARSEGVSESTIARMTEGLTFNPRIIALDRAQPGSNPNVSPLYEPYRRSHIDGVRIAGGRRMLQSLGSHIPEVERRYGVPASIMVSIWGNETNYGTYKGDFDLARSLSSLAYEGRRRELFAGEFIALLKMADQGVPQYRLKGSWAGAFGNPQFLPSVFLRTAVDGDGDGDRDIWTSHEDTVASIANYFRDAGWRPGEPWGVRASVPAGLDASAFKPRVVSPACPRVHARHSNWKPVSQWRQLGVIPQGAIGENVMASLFQPDGPGTAAFLLTGNYRVILQYNCSNYYALTVGLLADEIAR
jgi:membrane-bound lytic murein transglycosylase B